MLAHFEYRLGREGAQESTTITDCACPAAADDATNIGRLEYSNVLRVVDQILTFASYLIE